MRLRRLLQKVSLAAWVFSPALVLAYPNTSRYSQWTRGPSTNADFFPLAVWLQNPSNAGRYRAAGFNTYVALWKGPTETQLDQLRKAGMRLICQQNQLALQVVTDPIIIGWMHGDEPDNAQELPGGRGYGPPVSPQKIVDSYHHLRAAEPSRPVLLNLGQGVAWDGWHGRGSRTNHPEDYPQYVQGSDIVSFDIYPAVHENKEVAGHLEYVARGVERLVQWTKGAKVVWNCLECTRISNPDRKPTPHEVRAEAWMSIIHGSQGLIFFVHQFKPIFREAALLDDPEMLAAVGTLNHQITELAPVLNQPTITNQLRVKTDNPSDVIATTVKRFEGDLYVFAVEMCGRAAKATFLIQGTQPGQKLELLDEKKSIPLDQGEFSDRFAPWEVRLYRLSR